MNISARNNELTSVERHIRLQNYVLQTFLEKKYDCKFWEAKSQASVDFVLQNEDNTFTPVEIKFEGKKRCLVKDFINE